MIDRVLDTIQGCTVTQYSDGRIEFIADADVDADGAYKAYHPSNSSGLDNLKNAGHDGNWWGVVTDNGEPTGTPVVQSSHDPAPGFYVSSTSYQWSEFGRTDPRRYLDSESVPFCVVGRTIRDRAKGVVLGCRARLTNTRTGKSVEAVVGDMGPASKIGEVSIAAAKALGLSGNARNGGTDEHIIKYELWPGTPAVVGGVTYKLISA